MFCKYFNDVDLQEIRELLHTGSLEIYVFILHMWYNIYVYILRVRTAASITSQYSKIKSAWRKVGKAVISSVWNSKELDSSCENSHFSLTRTWKTLKNTCVRAPLTQVLYWNHQLKIACVWQCLCMVLTLSYSPSHLVYRWKGSEWEYLKRSLTHTEPGRSPILSHSGFIKGME